MTTERITFKRREISARTRDQDLAQWVASLPPLFVSDSSITADVSAAAKKNLIRKVGARLYTTDRTTPIDEFLRTHALQVASLRCPGCVLSHRTALEMSPADGHLFLTGPKNRTERLHGLTLKVKRGPGPLEGDTEFLDLHTASTARAFVENLAYTRHSAGVSRALSRAQIETRLEEHLRRDGEGGLNLLRDHARRLAPQLDALEAFEVLDGLIGALLNSRLDVALEVPVALAWQAGAPYEGARLRLFEILAEELHTQQWRDVSRPRAPLLREETQNLAFIESYFSNYIEGTQFEIDEAREIIFERKTPAARPLDAHDIQGTFDLLVSNSEMISVHDLDNIEDLEYVLARRHAKIMGARKDKRPGQFKQKNNRAGNTVFVAPDLVRGTLKEGLALFQRLETPFQRAAFMMFMISEIHPFDDGNGRLARAMMSAELASGNENRILIVTSFRIDYLGALRRLSREQDPTVYLRMLDRAHEFSARLDYQHLDPLLDTLRSCNAFEDSEQAIMKLPPVRLRP